MTRQPASWLKMATAAAWRAVQSCPCNVPCADATAVDDDDGRQFDEINPCQADVLHMALSRP